MRCIDSHCHLQDPAYAADREMVYQRAQALGIGLVIPGYSLESSRDAVAFVQSHADSWALVGVHPHDASEYTEDTHAELAAMLAEPRVLGVGEIGLDFHYNNSPPDVQEAAFLRQLQLARELHKPVAIHSREAESRTLALLEAEPPERAVLHCFTGSMEFAEALWKRGFFTSLAGVVTFKSASALRAVAAAAPMSQLLIETDAPYLAPTPWRGQRNEPAWVIRVGETLAAQKNCSTEEVFLHTMENTYRALF